MGRNLIANSEWNIMESLWENSPQTVMQLTAALAKRVGWAKSTTITTLRRMEGKGLVRCTQEGRTRYYVPALAREKAVLKETRAFLDRVYQGSLGLMIYNMVLERALSRAEIDDLLDLLNQAEKVGGFDE